MKEIKIRILDKYTMGYANLLDVRTIMRKDFPIKLMEDGLVQIADSDGFLVIHGSGMKDAFNKEIFENDIVRYEVGNNRYEYAFVYLAGGRVFLSNKGFDKQYASGIYKDVEVVENDFMDIGTMLKIGTIPLEIWCKNLKVVGNMLNDSGSFIEYVHGEE